MKIKVCGMKNPENIAELSALPIDMMGFIFYAPSPRYVGNLDPETLPAIPDNIRKVGVFVDETTNNIISKADLFNLQAIQLHGKESPETCSYLKEKGYIIIKAFSIQEETDIQDTEIYEAYCDFFLFDTKTPSHGGSGKQFDWNILNAYHGKTPFFLSGGIGINDIQQLKAFHHEKWQGIDLNSCFESAPGQKNISLLQQFIQYKMILNKDVRNKEQGLYNPL